MSTVNNKEIAMVTVSDLARMYQKSKTWIREQLNPLEDKIKDRPDRDKLIVNKGGPFAKEYSLEFVRQELDKFNNDMTTLQKVFGGTSRFDGTIKTHSKSNTDKPVLAGVLESRYLASQAYDTLLNELIINSKNLLIRVISGRDFFDSHKPVAKFLIDRKEEKNTKILLLYPFGTGAKIRAAAENLNSIETSTFGMDYLNTYSFLLRNMHLNSNIIPKWADTLHHSFLIWGESFALIESYDHGRPDNSLSGCIGRNAPMLVVNGGTDYHRMLHRGFEYIFGKKMKEDTSKNTGIPVFNIDQVGTQFRPLEPTLAARHDKP